MIANASRKNGAVRDARRMAALERAAEIVGGQAALADALGIATRQLRQKISAERPIHDEDVRLAIGALSARARQADELAARLTSLIDGQESNQ
ncbi:MAG TPA: hypothetical protein VKQ09_05825 [Sphingomonas sp.]|nr:hypothetical protein [Sphingomonas sp.]